jgi:hypothetical protein
MKVTQVHRQIIQRKISLPRISPLFKAGEVTEKPFEEEIRFVERFFRRI